MRRGEVADGICLRRSGVDCGTDGELDRGIEGDAQAGEAVDGVEVAGEAVRERLVEAFASIGLDDIGELVIGVCASGFENPAHGGIGL